MIVSLSGKPGSGKSTVAKRLAAVLGFERIYVGGLRREAARKRSLTLAEFNAWSETNKSGDLEFDEQIADLGRTKDNFVIESRTAFHFIPHSLKIFLDVSPAVGAERIWKAMESSSQPNRNEDSNLRSYRDVLASVEKRIASDTVRYRKHYGIEIFNRENYDLFLDTSELTPEQEYQEVYRFVMENLKNARIH